MLVGVYQSALGAGRVQVPQLDRDSSKRFDHGLLDRRQLGLPAEVRGYPVDDLGPALAGPCSSTKVLSAEQRELAAAGLTTAVSDKGITE